MHVFTELLKAYYTPSQGLIFAICHIALIVLFLQRRGGIGREAARLRDWKPRVSPKSLSTQVLDEFVDECDRMAAQGILPPLTDFTDRLDSIVDGEVGRLHDLINLFLVVGVAGTVFGMYYFVQARGEIESRLTNALSKALPVAFMGLVFYVLGYLLASGPEQKLRGALASATNQALQHRRSKGQSVVGAIQEALKPLQHLEVTLTQVVQPVIEEWGKRLEQAYSVVHEQTDALASSVKAINAAVEGVRSSVDELRKVTESLKDLIARTPSILDKLDLLSTQHMNRLEELTQLIEAVNETAGRSFRDFASSIAELRTIFQALHGLPEDLRESIVTSLQSVKEQLPTIWKEAIDSLGESIADIAGKIEEETQAASKIIEAASGKWNELARDARAIFQTAFDESLDRVTKVAREELPKIDDAFAQRFPEAVSTMEKAVCGWQTLVADLTKLNDELKTMLEEVRAIEFPGDAVRKLDQILGSIDQTRKLVGDGSGRTLFMALAQFDSSVRSGFQQVNGHVQAIEKHHNQRRFRWPFGRT